VLSEQECRTFSSKFKQEAASSVLDQGYRVAKACRSLVAIPNAEKMQLS
jgi:transposase-like protein